MRNVVGTQAVGECFHSFFEFFQTFTSVSIKQLDYELKISIVWYTVVGEGTAWVNHCTIEIENK